MNSLIFATYPISSPMGERWGSYHKGTDYAVPANTSIQSTTSGTVTKTGYDADGWGYYVTIKDDWGYKHTYAHLNKITATEGQAVVGGQQIGLSGSTGFSTGNHLHYEVRNAAGQSVDGQSFIDMFINGDEVREQIRTEQAEAEKGGGSLAEKAVSFACLLALLGAAVVFLYLTFQ